MPDVRVYFAGAPAILTISGEYKPGDLPPTGYSAREDWFWVQRRAGLRQKECPRCWRWCFPQELLPGRQICRNCLPAESTETGGRIWSDS